MKIFGCLIGCFLGLAISAHGEKSFLFCREELGSARTAELLSARFKDRPRKDVMNEIILGALETNQVVYINVSSLGFSVTWFEGADSGMWRCFLEFQTHPQGSIWAASSGKRIEREAQPTDEQIGRVIREQSAAPVAPAAEDR